MKSWSLRILLPLISTTFLIPASASAREERVSSLIYNCNLSFQAKGQSVAIGIGFTRISGQGEIRCYDLLTGATERIPVRVEGRGPSVGLKVSGFNLSGGATGLGLSTGPRSLLGSYAGIKGSVAIIKGVGATVALRLARSNLTINVALNGESGFGAGLDGLVIDLREAPGAQVDRPSHAGGGGHHSRPDHHYDSTEGARHLTIHAGQTMHIKDHTGRTVYVIRAKR